MAEVKRCSGKCGLVLPRTLFYRFVRLGEKVRYSGKCIPCTSEYVKQRYHARTPDERREAQRKNTEWTRQKRIKKPGWWTETNRRHDLRKKFGITIAEYDRLLDLQSERCAICGEVNQCKRRLAVDHDHDTLQVRGLLCGRCNTCLERMEAVPGWHEKALAYLAKFSR